MSLILLLAFSLVFCILYYQWRTTKWHFVVLHCWCGVSWCCNLLHTGPFIPFFIPRLLSDRELDLYDGTRLLRWDRFQALKEQLQFSDQQLRERYSHTNSTSTWSLHQTWKSHCCFPKLCKVISFYREGKRNKEGGKDNENGITVKQKSSIQICRSGSVFHWISKHSSLLML